MKSVHRGGLPIDGELRLRTSSKEGKLGIMMPKSFGSAAAIFYILCLATLPACLPQRVCTILSLELDWPMDFVFHSSNLFERLRSWTKDT